MYATKYEGKYTARRKHRRQKRWPGVMLFALNLCLLIVCTVRIVSSGTVEAMEYTKESISVTKPTENFLATTEKWITDREAPQIIGVRDIAVYAGDPVSYLEAVTARDAHDGLVEVSVDNSAVNPDVPGTYEVSYFAQDASGNTVTRKASVTVLARGEGYVDMETIHAAADAVLEQIICSGSGPKEQVGAIYTWAHDSLRYGGHTDRTDWYQAAYTMLTTGRGDCYGYFAATKLLLERLDIPNIDVEKVKNSESDSSHFWSLVSIDGGESYFHFDATPRIGQTQDFCLVTDAILDAYSDANKGSHNRDTSLYPATPEERP